jgi:hypothetical protein
MYYVKGSSVIFNGCEVLAEFLRLARTMEGVNVRTRLRHMLMEECLQYIQFESTSLGPLER